MPECISYDLKTFHAEITKKRKPKKKTKKGAKGTKASKKK